MSIDSSNFNLRNKAAQMLRRATGKQQVFTRSMGTQVAAQRSRSIFSNQQGLDARRAGFMAGNSYSGVNMNPYSAYSQNFGGFVQNNNNKLNPYELMGILQTGIGVVNQSGNSILKTIEAFKTLKKDKTPDTTTKGTTTTAPGSTSNPASTVINNQFDAKTSSAIDAMKQAGDADALSNAITAAENELSTQNSYMDNIKADYDKAKSGLADKKTELGRAKEKKDTADREVQGKKSAVDKCQSQLVGAQNGLSQAQRDYSDARAERIAADAAVNSAQSNFDAINTALSTAEAEGNTELVAALQTKLEEASNALKLARSKADQAEKAEEAAEKAVKKAKESVEEVKNKMKDAEDALKTAEDELVNAEKAAKKAELEYEKLDQEVKQMETLIKEYEAKQASATGLKKEIDTQKQRLQDIAQKDAVKGNKWTKPEKIRH